MSGTPAVASGPGGLLQKLFAGAAVVTEELPLSGEPPAGPDNDKEVTQIAKAVRSRRIEFLTGRCCARRALSRLGIHDFALLNGPDRAPRWPPGVVGSVTHTGRVPGGYCGVVVGRAADLLTLGLDAEEEEPLDPELWRLVLTDGERANLEQADPEERGLLAKIIFSAKECFYKAQYPLTGRLLQFRDVEVRLEPNAGTFQVGAAGGAAVPPRLLGCRGRYLVENELILSGMAPPS
jgi:4'-phosphopantetheinyl transferase EntD